MLDVYLEQLELAFYEIKFAFDGLADENVWKRPADGLLSIGELAGHVAHWEAVRLGGSSGSNEPDLAGCPISSLLIDPRFQYYPATLATPPSEAHRALTAEQVCAELLRVHAEAVACFKARNPDLDSVMPGSPWPNGTYREFLKYQAFHVAYHAGQMYSARHLLGEETPDN